MRISDWSSDVCSSDLPSLYLAVRPISRDGTGKLNLNGQGDTVDWLLEMVRFADGALLEEVAARGELDDRLVTKLADQIKAFHNDAEQYRAQSGRDHRSEEHTSELQSLMRISYAVFCLKKNTQKQNTT